MGRYSAAVTNALNAGARQVLQYGTSLAAELEALWEAIDLAGFGFTATAAQIDAAAKLDGFAWNQDGTAGTTFGYRAGAFHNGRSMVFVAEGTVGPLPNSTTCYIEVDRSGTVSYNTTAFTVDRMPLFVVSTGVSVITALSVVNKKPAFTLIGNRGVNGLMLSTTQATKSIDIPLGTVGATSSFIVPSLPAAATLVGASIVVATTLTASDSTYWTFSLVNKGPAGSGTTAMLAATDPNTTKATGGAGLTGYVDRALTLHATPAQLVTAAKDALVLTATKTSSVADLVGAVLRLDFMVDA